MQREARRYLLAGLGLILAINLIALAGVAYNRSGAAHSRLLLSERELPRPNPRHHPENSGLTLQVRWNIADDNPFAQGLSTAQMVQLGYAPHSAEHCTPRCPRDAVREALAVLELDGPAYRRHLERQRQRVAEAEQALAVLPQDSALRERANEARDTLQRLETGSRLYLVDVGRDADALRQRYPDRQQYAILKGQVHAWHSGDQLRGRVTLQGAGRISMPRHWRARLPGRVETQHEDTARYRIEVSFGKRLEPWISDVPSAGP